MKAPLFLLLATLLAPSAHAGAKDGGGGAQIVAAFRLKAYALISQIGDNVQANALCSSAKLQAALDSANIRVVDTLIDPRTNQPIADKSLDAWTIPGDVQLKTASWGYFVDPKSIVPADHSVSTLVIHEVYRATGTCDDDHFQLSEKVLGMLGGHAPAKFTEAFEFKYLYSAPDRTDDNSETVGWWGLTAVDQFYPADFACDKPAYTGKKLNVGLVMNCLAKDGKLYQGIKVGKYEGYANGWYGSAVSKVKTVEGFIGVDLDNQWLEISPAHPFVVMHDITNGKWSWSIE